MFKWGGPFSTGEGRGEVSGKVDPVVWMVLGALVIAALYWLTNYIIATSMIGMLLGTVVIP